MTIEDLITDEDIERATREIQGGGDYEDAEALVLRVIAALSQKEQTERMGLAGAETMLAALQEGE